MNRTNTIRELFKAGNKLSQIAQTVGLTPQRVHQILKKEGLKKTNFNYSPKITEEVSKIILFLHEQNKNVTDISKAINITPPAIRSFLKKKGLTPNINTVDRERPCVICRISFTPPYSDGIKKDKYKTCSKECLSIHLSDVMTKYTNEEIEKVKVLKKEGIPNDKIFELTGVNINKIKEIVKENELFLTPEKAQQNAYQSKMEKDPFCMQKMRECHMEFTGEEFLQKISLLEEEILKGAGTVGGLAPKFGLIPGSAIQYFNENGKKHLVGLHDSTPQRELERFFKDLLKEEIIYNTRKIISPLELDIYIPSLNLAIEYCGLYWHSEEKKVNNYHYNKMKLCNQKGIRLITIFEDEWVEHRKQIENFLLSVINKNTVSVGARKTKIKEVDKETASKFLNDHHIQGNASMAVAFGLYDQDLVAVITGNRHHRQGFEDTFVLNRLAFKSNTSVSGGSSKLLKKLAEYAKEKGYKKLISWSDNRYSEGRVYEKLGFALEEESGPDYSYVVKNQKRSSKQSCQKKHLIEKGAVGETEHEMARSLGYTRIYDCGKKRWSFKL